MLKVDLHVHSLFSFCACHTIIELLNHGKSLGMEGIAITDHGPKFGGEIPSTFFDRLENPVPGIKMLKGMESNIIDLNGGVDFPKRYLKHVDIVLAGLHHIIEQNRTKSEYTYAYIKVMEKNRFVDILTHINLLEYPIDTKAVVRAAKEFGVAIEINNARNRFGWTTEESTRELVKICLEENALIAINSDTHALNELGGDSFVRKFVDEVNYPSHLIVNRNLESTLKFLENRRELKLSSM